MAKLTEEFDTQDELEPGQTNSWHSTQKLDHCNLQICQTYSNHLQPVQNNGIEYRADMVTDSVLRKVVQHEQDLNGYGESESFWTLLSLFIYASSNQASCVLVSLICLNFVFSSLPHLMALTFLIP